MSAGIRAGSSNDGYLQVNGVDIMPFGANLAIGRLINIVVITANGTYTPTPGTKVADIEGIGGGGAGGGMQAAAPNAGAGGGGSAGTWGRKRVVNPVATAVTVGAGGVPAAGAAGGSGGTSTFGALLTLPGGGGGAVGSPIASAGVNGGPGARSAAATGADISSPGAVGGVGLNLLATNALSGAGADSQFGCGGSPIGVFGTVVSPGNAAGGYGAGGSGAAGSNNGATQVGGAGSPGVWVIREYA